MPREVPAYELVLVEGEGAPATLAVRQGHALVLGTDPGCDLVLESERVSRRHARVEVVGGEVFVEDLGSTKGTRVNGSEVTRSRLAPGDRVQLYRSVLELRASGGAAVASGPPEGATRGEHLLRSLAALLVAGEGASPLERMLEGLLAAFDADRGFVFLPEGGGEFYCAARRARGGGAPGDAGVSTSLLARVAATERAVLLTSAETEELKQEIASIAGELRSILAAPFEAPRGGTGVVYLDGEYETRRFGEAERALLMTFAEAAASSLRRDREARRSARRADRLAELERRRLAAAEMLGECAAMKAVLADLARAAATDVSVLVTGESGTGKELAARAVHASSDRRDQPFVAINCAAIPGDLVESELFGSEKGAFSGADARRLGQFELAEGGTLFLDEAGELPLPVQAKLLRALQEKRIRRVGGAEELPVDFRLVCATNVALEEAVAEGRFREDLFYRIAVFRVELPPLRARGEDVLLLAERFREEACREYRRPLEGFAPDARAALLAHPWPGNIRELRNVVQQAVIREPGTAVSASVVAPALGGPATRQVEVVAAAAPEYPPDLAEARARFEREHITRQLQAHDGQMKTTAETLGVARKTLYAKCEELGIDYTLFR